MKSLRLLLLALCSVASAQTYYNETTIPPVIPVNGDPGNFMGIFPGGVWGATPLSNQHAPLYENAGFSGPDSDSESAFAIHLRMNDNGVTYSGSGALEGIYSNVILNSGSLTGGRGSGFFALNINVPTGNTFQQYAALASACNMKVTDATTGSTCYGFNAVTNTSAGATVKNEVGGEFDTVESVGAVISGYRAALIAVDTSAANADIQAAIDDYAIGMSYGNNWRPNTAGSTHGFKTGLSMGGHATYFPVSSTGTMFSAEDNGVATTNGDYTVANIFDFHHGIVTGYMMNAGCTSSACGPTGQWTVDGTGNETLTSIVLGGATGGSKGAGTINVTGLYVNGTNVPYTALQGGVPFVLAGGAASNMGNNGALTAITAIPATIANAYVFATPGTIGNATAASVTITGTAGQFACTCTNLAVGQYFLITGTYGGTGSITGYVNPTLYYISATNGTSTFTLQTAIHTAIVTTAGTPTGLTYGAGGGWFYAQGSSTTAFTLFNNLYVSGNPTIPGSPTAFVTTGVGGFTQVTGFNIPGPSITIPANTLSVNGEVDVRDSLVFTNSASTKTTQVQFSGASVDGQNYTTSVTGLNDVRINPEGITSKSVNSSSNWVAPNNVVAGIGEIAIDTTNPEIAQISMQLNTAAADYMILKSYSIRVIP